VRRLPGAAARRRPAAAAPRAGAARRPGPPRRGPPHLPARPGRGAALAARRGELRGLLHLRDRRPGAGRPGRAVRRLPPAAPGQPRPLRRLPAHRAAHRAQRLPGAVPHRGRRGLGAQQTDQGHRPAPRRPGAGRRRGRAAAADAKTHGENLMIADLIRNDLGRVCEPGTVQVPRLMGVESYATVHQLVTSVQGRLRPGRDALDCLRALFPGGSMTGAPKERTVALLEGLEAEPRGPYAGCLGYLGFNGTADLSIVIRTLVCDPGGARLGTGGAVTALSDPEEEYRETLLKAAAVLACLGAEPPGAAAAPRADDSRGGGRGTSPRAAPAGTATGA